MNLRKKIAQMLIMGFSGAVIDESNPVYKWLNEEEIGGVLLFDYDLHTKQFGKNIQNREQIKKLTQKLNNFAPQHHSNGPNLPLFVAIDYEGGPVDRFRHVDGCMQTISPQQQGLLGDKELLSEAKKMAISLQELGFNLNFAPVVDLNLNSEQGIIGKLGRSFSSASNDVIRAANQFVKAFSQHGIVTAYKHFPGHGSACGDTHEDFVDVSNSFQSAELDPYEHLSAQDWPTMVMTAHVINKQLDPSGLPATLSYPVLTGLLRQKLVFNGVIISDDLQMPAISKHFSHSESLRLTINAGADMLIFANQLDTVSAQEIINCIEELVQSRDIDVMRIEQAYQRICRLKQTMPSSVAAGDSIISFES